MTKREDGKETRLRLLNAAGEVFAEKGYRDAKVASLLGSTVVPVALDVDRNGRELSDTYEVDGLPTVVVFDIEGRELGHIPVVDRIPVHAAELRIVETLVDGLPHELEVVYVLGDLGGNSRRRGRRPTGSRRGLLRRRCRR